MVLAIRAVLNLGSAYNGEKARVRVWVRIMVRGRARVRSDSTYGVTIVLVGIP